MKWLEHKIKLKIIEAEFEIEIVDIRDITILEWALLSSYNEIPDISLDEINKELGFEESGFLEKIYKDLEMIGVIEGDFISARGKKLLLQNKMESLPTKKKHTLFYCSTNREWILNFPGKYETKDLDYDKYPNISEKYLTQLIIKDKNKDIRNYNIFYASEFETDWSVNIEIISKYPYIKLSSSDKRSNLFNINFDTSLNQNEIVMDNLTNYLLKLTYNNLIKNIIQYNADSIEIDNFLKLNILINPSSINFPKNPEIIVLCNMRNNFNANNIINIENNKYSLYLNNLSEFEEIGMINSIEYSGQINLEEIKQSLIIFENVGYTLINIEYNDTTIPILGKLRDSRKLYQSIIIEVLDVIEMDKTTELIIRYELLKEDEIRNEILLNIFDRPDYLEVLAIFANKYGTKDIVDLIKARIVKIQDIIENKSFLDKIFDNKNKEYIELIINLYEPEGIFNFKEIYDDISKNVSIIVFNGEINDDINDQIVKLDKFKKLVSDNVKLSIQKPVTVNYDEMVNLKHIIELLEINDKNKIIEFIDKNLYIPKIDAVDIWFNLIKQFNFSKIYKRFADKFFNQLNEGWIHEMPELSYQSTVQKISEKHISLWRKLSTRLLSLIDKNVFIEINPDKLIKELHNWEFLIDKLGELKSIVVNEIKKEYPVCKNDTDTIKWITVVKNINRFKKLNKKEILEKCAISSLSKELIINLLEELTINKNYIMKYIRDNSHTINEIVVDGPNVLRDGLLEDEINKNEDAERIIILYDKLKSIGIPKVTIILSAASQHYTNNSELWDDYIKSGNIIISPAKKSDDYYAIQLALENEAYILTNDQYRDWAKDNKMKKWLDSHRLSFKWIKNDNKFILDETLTKLEVKK